MIIEAKVKNLSTLVHYPISNLKLVLGLLRNLWILRLCDNPSIMKNKVDKGSIAGNKLLKITKYPNVDTISIYSSKI